MNHYHILTGAPGTGKTTLLNELSFQFDIKEKAAREYRYNQKVFLLILKMKIVRVPNGTAEARVCEY